jgi:subtilisin family serine protease
MEAPAIIVAIIDSGVDTAHEDLRLMAGWDYGDGDNNPWTMLLMPDTVLHVPDRHCQSQQQPWSSRIAGGCTVMPLKVSRFSRRHIFYRH